MKKNKKGNKAFTLAEILGVIVIIGLLIIIVTPSLLNSINNKRQTVSDTEKQLAYNAADLYMGSNKEKYVLHEKNRYCIPIKELKNKSYLSNKFKSLTGENYPYIMVTIGSNGKKTYEFKTACSDYYDGLITINTTSKNKWSKSKKVTITYPRKKDDEKYQYIVKRFNESLTNTDVWTYTEKQKETILFDGTDYTNQGENLYKVYARIVDNNGNVVTSYNSYKDVKPKHVTQSVQKIDYTPDECSIAINTPKNLSTNWYDTGQLNYTVTVNANYSPIKKFNKDATDNKKYTKTSVKNINSSDDVINIVYKYKDEAGNQNTCTHEETKPDAQLTQYTATFTKETGIASIGKTILTCRVPSGQNSCDITLPSITKSAGYTVQGWYEGSTFKGNANGKVTLTKDTTTFTAKAEINKLTIEYDMNGGTLSESSNGYNHSGSLITKNGSTIVHKYNYGGGTTENGLLDVSSSNLKITKTGHSAVKGSEWCTEKNGTGNCFSQSKVYAATDLYSGLSNASKTITLYVNWKINVLQIQYDMNKGTLSTTDSNYGHSGSLITKNNNTVVHEVKYGNKLKYGLLNVVSDNRKITRDWYSAVKGSEWCTGENGGGSCFDEDTQYAATKLASNLDTGDRTIKLFVHWRYNKLCMRYNTAGGKLYKDWTGKQFSKDSSDFINNSKFTQKCTYIRDNGPDEKHDFYTWNQQTKKTNYETDDNVFRVRCKHNNIWIQAVRGSEWSVTGCGQSSKKYNQTSQQKSKDICPTLKNGDQTLKLYLNWTTNGKCVYDS